MGLRGAAQRAQVLEHALGVAALVGRGGALAAVLELAHEAAVDRQGGDDDVPERAPGVQLAADALELSAEAHESFARRARADLREPSRVGAGRDQVAVVLIAGERDHAAGGRRADAAPRRLHGAPEGLRVGRVGQQPEVGHRVADFRALVEAEAAEHPVRDPGGRERGLRRLGAVAGARQHHDLPRRHAARQRVGDRARDPVRLVAVGREPGDADLPARSAHRDQRLAGAPRVVGHAGDGRLEDLGPAAEVAAEHDLGMARVALAEVEHVARVGSAPPVIRRRGDRLIVVADDRDVAGQERDEHALGLVGVLELVDQEPAPALPVERQPVRVLGQQPHRVDEQVVEVERVASAAARGRARARPRRRAAPPRCRR